jgi:hypothetical protein
MRLKSVVMVSLVVVLIMGFSWAQQAHEKPLKPGDKIPFEVKLNGPDTEKVTAVSLNFGLQSQPSHDQEGFGTQGFGGNSSVAISPGTFHVDVTVGDVPSGTYRLIQASAGTPYAGHAYSPADFGDFTVVVENPKTFTPPKITIKKLP